MNVKDIINILNDNGLSEVEELVAADKYSLINFINKYSLGNKIVIIDSLKYKIINIDTPYIIVIYTITENDISL